MEVTTVAHTAATAARAAGSLRWDSPFRWAASVLAIASIVGRQHGHKPLEVLANGFDAIGVTKLSGTTLDAHQWASTHLSGELTTNILALIVVAGIIFVWWGEPELVGRRSAPAMLIALAAATYVPGAIRELTGSAVVTIVCMLIYLRWIRGEQMPLVYAGDWLASLIISLVAAAVWLPLSLIRWLFFRH